MTPQLRVGVTIQAVDQPDVFVRFVEDVEEGGYDHLWIADSSLHARAVWPYLTLAATRSRSLLLGTNCTNPHTRNIGITINALVTLNELSRGRAVLGLGAGDSPVVELGLPIARLAQVEATIDTARRLLAGEQVDDDREHISLRGARVRYGLESFGSPPIYVTASGPRMLRLAGRLGDGVLVHCGASRAGIEFAIEQIRGGAEEAGRDPDEIDIVWQLFGTYDNDSKRAVEASRARAAWFAVKAPRYCELAGAEPDVIGAVQERYGQGHFFHEAVDVRAEFPPAELVRALIVAGDENAWADRLEVARAVGVSHINVWPLGDRQRTVTEVGKIFAAR